MSRITVRCGSCVIASFFFLLTPARNSVAFGTVYNESTDDDQADDNCGTVAMYILVRLEGRPRVEAFANCGLIFLQHRRVISQ
jgi:hypothetical protein